MKTTIKLRKDCGELYVHALKTAGIFLSCMLVIHVLNSCHKEEPVQFPALNTFSASEIRSTSAKSGGNVTSDGGSAIIARGIVWGSIPSPTIEQYTGITSEGIGAGIFTSTATDLDPGTRYHLRAYASNVVGTAYGNEIEFLAIELPIVATKKVTNITAFSAVSGGDIESDGGSAITVSGVCWRTSRDPTIDDDKIEHINGNESYVSTLTNLVSTVTYYVRAYAINEAGVGYGAEEKFQTLRDSQNKNGVIFNLSLEYGLAKDIEGNKYRTIKIGSQIWMAENLRVSKLNDDTDISNVSNEFEWKSIWSPAYCWYNNDDKINASTYGALYNWHTVNTNKLCPTGWHVPSNEEWLKLYESVGGNVVAGGGGRMKEQGTIHWYEPNLGANNSSGFTGLPGGLRSYVIEDYEAMGSIGYYWTSTPDVGVLAKTQLLMNTNSELYDGQSHKGHGHSVRCLKD